MGQPLDVLWYNCLFRDRMISIEPDFCFPDDLIYPGDKLLRMNDIVFVLIREVFG